MIIPTKDFTPKFYGLPKIHNFDIPLRPIVSSRGAIMYGVAKQLANIISPLVDHSPHHTRNTQHFTDHIKTIQLQQVQCLVAYEVKALFTSVPFPLSKINYNRSVYFPKGSSCLSYKIIISLEFCLKNTYDLFPGNYFEQAHGTAMGFPIILLIVNLLMEEFEAKVISPAASPPRL